MCPLKIEIFFIQISIHIFLGSPSVILLVSPRRNTCHSSCQRKVPKPNFQMLKACCDGKENI